MFKEDCLGRRFFCGSLLFLTTFAAAQMNRRSQSAAADDQTSWLVIDFSKSTDLRPATVESPVPSFASPLYGSAADIRLNSFVPVQAASKILSYRLMVDCEGRFPSVICDDPRMDETYVQECDAALGVVRPIFTLSRRSVPLAISPDGKRLICQTRLLGHRDSYLDIWALKDPPHLMSHVDRGSTSIDRKNLASASQFDNPIVSAAFLDADHLITVDQSNRLSLLLLGTSSISEVYHVVGDPNDITFQVSPDGRFVSGVYSGHMIVLNAATGKCVRYVSSPRVRLAGRISLDPNAKRMLITGQESLLLNLENGQLLPCAAPASSTNEPATWIDDNLIFTGSILYDVDRRNFAWSYLSESRIGIVMCPGDGAWYMRNLNRKLGAEPIYSLSRAALPDKAGLDADAKLQQAKLLAGPGSKVTVVLRMDAMPKDQKEVILVRVIDLLKQNKMTVSAVQPIKLIVEMNPENPSQSNIPGSVAENPNRRAMIRPATYRWSVSFEINGRQLWRIEGLRRGAVFLGPKGGQTAADAIKEYEDDNRPNANLILSQFDHLPPEIYDTSDPATIGITNLPPSFGR